MSQGLQLVDVKVHCRRSLGRLNALQTLTQRERFWRSCRSFAIEIWLKLTCFIKPGCIGVTSFYHALYLVRIPQLHKVKSLVLQLLVLQA